MVAMNEKTRAYVYETKNERMDKKKEIRARSLCSPSIFPLFSLSLAGRPHCMHNLKTTMFMNMHARTFNRRSVYVQLLA